MIIWKITNLTKLDGNFSWIEDERVYIQMEYCNQGNLAQLIERHEDLGRPIKLEKIKQIASDVANGLEIIHSKGLVHNDLKPDNIFR